MNRMKRMTIGLLGAGLLLGATAARGEEKPAAGIPSPGSATWTKHWGDAYEYNRRNFNVHPINSWGYLQKNMDPEFYGEVRRVAGDVQARWDQVLKEIGEGKVEELYTTTAQRFGLLMGIQEKAKGGTIPQSWLDKLEPADRERRAEQGRKIQTAFQKWAEEDKKAYETARKAGLDANPEWAAADRRLTEAAAKLEALGVNVRGEPKDRSRKLTAEETAAAAAAATEYQEAEPAARRLRDTVHKSPEMQFLRTAAEWALDRRSWGWNLGNVNKAAGEERPMAARILGMREDGYAYDKPEQDGRAGAKTPITAGLPRIEEGGNKPGTARTVDLGGGVKLDLVWIPAGEFMMGSTWGEKCRRANEKRHRVKLTKGFWMGKYEVTQEQWQRVIGSNPSWFQKAGPKAPVECVRWYDIHEFLRKLSEMTAGTKDGAGGKFRLPTEAEWEWACRADTDTPLYTGDLTVKGANNCPELDAIAWYGGNSGVEYEGGLSSAIWPDKQYDHRVAGTHPVGQKKPNAWGLYDMLGNVSEWCQDGYGPYPSGSVTDPGPEKPPTGTEDQLVLRGGSWDDCVLLCRSPARSSVVSGFVFRNPVTGFRVVMDEPAPAEKK